MATVKLTGYEKMIAASVGATVILTGGGTGINMGLYFPEKQTDPDTLEPTGVNVYFPEKDCIYVQNFNQVGLDISQINQPLVVECFADNGNLSHRELVDTDGRILWSEYWANPHEAILTFYVWLTTLPEPLVLSAKHAPFKLMELIAIFAKEQALPPVGDDYLDKLKSMDSVILPKSAEPKRILQYMISKIGDGSIGYIKGCAYNVVICTNPGGGWWVIDPEHEEVRLFYNSLPEFLDEWDFAVKP